MNSLMKFSAAAIAEKLRLPIPTPEQQAIIESDPHGCALVIAGAGSGKTATMASRVVWLLANGHASPHDILGLTFTRKAAGELSERVALRIRQLVASNVVKLDFDVFSEPVISTYNSYASSIYRDFAARIGWDADARVLSEASAWSLARGILTTGSRPELAKLDSSVDTIIEAVLKLSRDMMENSVDADELRAFAAEFTETASRLEPGPRYEYLSVFDYTDRVAQLPILIDLALEYQARKRARGFVEFSDQVALALRIIRGSETVRTDIAGRHPFVLLDEYQDTSVGQSLLLSELFRESSVMAVGDPHQAIYGWRGASASNLTSYRDHFRAGEDYSLSVSWRNGIDILAAANAIAAPLNTELEAKPAHKQIAITKLVQKPTATNYPVQGTILPSTSDEVEAVADFLESHLRPGAEVSEAWTPPSAAILLRKRKFQSLYCAELSRRGIPFHVLGIGGLLGDPAVADLYCAMSVATNPTAGPELVRLLGGAHWNVGVSDIYELSRYSRNLSNAFLSDKAADVFHQSVVAADDASIVDALDNLRFEKETTIRDKTGSFYKVDLSDSSIERMKSAAEFFSDLRTRVHLPLLDFIRYTAESLKLDIEVVANPDRSSRASLDAFNELALAYLAVADSPTVDGFVRWVREAERRENLSPRSDPPEPGTVQILTIHASKGLEWDVVAVPGFVTKTLPSEARDRASGWFSVGALPFEFRDDHEDLAKITWRGVTERKDMLDKIEAFSDDCKALHELEERRLAYVAVTRARDHLLVTGAIWQGENTTPVAPSPYYSDMAGACLHVALPGDDFAGERPEESDRRLVHWPADPLGGRRERVEQAAAAVASATGEPREAALIERLIAQRDAGAVAVPMGVRISASRFAEWSKETDGATKAPSRPVPTQPYRAARRGTVFHAWVERRTYDPDAQTIDLPEDERLSDEQLVALQEKFLTSRWGKLIPEFREIEIIMPIGEHVVVCKIDAVFRDGDNWTVVDWKTGAVPTEEEIADKAMQLVLYRRALIAWGAGTIDADNVTAAFYYVAKDKTIEFTAAELNALEERLGIL